MDKNVIHISLIRLLFGGIVLAVFLSFPLPALAKTIEWTGASGGWNNLANWSTHTVPTLEDNVVIPTSNSQITVNQTTQVHSLTLSDHFTGSILLNSGSDLQIVSGNLTIQGGSIVPQSDKGGSIIFSGVDNSVLSCQGELRPLVVIAKTGSLTVENNCQIYLGHNPISSGQIINNGVIKVGHGVWHLGSYTQNSSGQLTMDASTMLVDGDLIINGGEFPSDISITIADNGRVVLPCADNLLNSVKVESGQNDEINLTVNCVFSNLMEAITKTIVAGAGLLSLPPMIGDILSSLYRLRDLPGILLRYGIVILQFFGLRKKGRSWGIVYDSLNKQPIDPAVVTLFTVNSTGLKKIATAVTDFRGRFGFLVDKGSYLLKVAKSDYLFPSEILKGHRADEEIENLYFGGEFEVPNPDLVNLAIPMDQVQFDWNQAHKPILYHPSRFHFIQQIIHKLFWVGFGLSILSVILDHSLVNIGVTVLYLLVLILHKLLVVTKKWGRVYYESSHEVLPLATIRALRSSGVLDGICVTDHIGRYFLILNEGEHMLQVEQKQGDKVTILKKIGPITVKKNDSIVSPDIAI